MKISLRFAARCALVSLCALTSVTPVLATQFYATPAGAGSLNGSSWADAYPQTEIQAAVTALAAGDTLNLGSGTYTIAALNIAGHGTAAARISLLGVDTGGGLPLILGTFDVATAASTSFISFPKDVGTSYWTIKNLRFQNQPVGINMLLSDATTDTVRTNILFENLAFDSVEDAIRLRNASAILVKNCSVIRHTKKAFRIGRYCSFVTFDRCVTDCNGGDDAFPARSIPTGFSADSTGGLAIIHDLTFLDCTARNNRWVQPSGDYWNGDGFVTEDAAYNISYIRCTSFDNHDGGFDDKADNLLYQDCVAAGNKRGFRIWGTGAQMVNCVAAFNASWGGASSSHGVWVSGSGGSLAISDSTFHDNAGLQILGESGATISANNCILSTTDSATTQFASTLVTMTNTVTYRPGSGTDPNYVAPLSTWRGAPLDAMNSQTYGLTKGYNSSDVSYPTNAAPTLTIGATPVSGTVPLVVNFTATAADADGVVVACAWDFKHGGTSTLYNVSTIYAVAGTYNVTCTVTDNLGATTTQTVTITATAPTTPVISRIEAGSTASFTDGAGNVWMADHSFGSGGGIVDRGALAIANTTDDRIYQTERWGVSSYAIAVANGTYTVRLHFAETYTGITAAGQRVFSVTAEGSTPSGWANIDVFAQAGGRNIALIKTATVSVTDGTLNLGFAASVNSAMINGIEVLPMVDDITTITGATPVTAGTAYTVSVGYVAAASRRVYVEFRSPANSILASSYVTVAAGSGTANVTVTVPSTVTAGTGYRWTSKLKGAGGSPEYDRMDQTNVTVN